MEIISLNLSQHCYFCCWSYRYFCMFILPIFTFCWWPEYFNCLIHREFSKGCLYSLFKKQLYWDKLHISHKSQFTQCTIQWCSVQSCAAITTISFRAFSSHIHLREALYPLVVTPHFPSNLPATNLFPIFVYILNIP